MKLDRDLMRLVLLAVEEQGDSPNGSIDDFAIDGYTDAQVNHHVWLLHDGGFLEMLDLSCDDGDTYAPRCLTWRGHEYLNAIRDEEIWRQTKAAAKAGGAATIELIGKIAKALVLKKAESLTGLDLS